MHAFGETFDRAIDSREFRLLIGVSAILRAFTLFLQLCGSPYCGSFLQPTPDNGLVSVMVEQLKAFFSHSRIRDLIT
jgi:hypothetical protein